MTDGPPSGPAPKARSALAVGFEIAQRTHGLTPGQVRQAYRRSQPWRHRLLLSEFLLFRLYDPARDPRDFIGSYKAAKVAYGLNRYAPSRRIIGNKLYWDAVLSGLGFEVPRLQAVYGLSAGPTVPRLESREATRRFLRHDAVYPLFGKPAQGQASQFVLALDGYNARTRAFVDWQGRDIDSWQVFRPLEMRFQDKGFLFQSAVVQHPAVEAAIGRAVGCLRCVTFQSEAGVEVLGVAWKIPNAGAISDAGRLGGLAARLDQNTGRVESVFSSSDADAAEITHHPGTGARLVGFEIPNWEVIVRRVQEAARVLHHLPLVGWDIAIGPNGPVFVEANSSPSFWALQIGRERGIYTPELQARFAVEKARQVGLNGRWTARRARLRRNYGLLRSRVGAVFGK